MSGGPQAENSPPPPTRLLSHLRWSLRIWVVAPLVLPLVLPYLLAYGFPDAMLRLAALVSPDRNAGGYGLSALFPADFEALVAGSLECVAGRGGRVIVLHVAALVSVAVCALIALPITLPIAGSYFRRVVRDRLRVEFPQSQRLELPPYLGAPGPFVRRGGWVIWLILASAVALTIDLLGFGYVLKSACRNTGRGDGGWWIMSPTEAFFIAEALALAILYIPAWRAHRQLQRLD